MKAVSVDWIKKQIENLDLKMRKLNWNGKTKINKNMPGAMAHTSNPS
jgi:hypothetical protein